MLCATKESNRSGLRVLIKNIFHVFFFSFCPLSFFRQRFSFAAHYTLVQLATHNIGIVSMLTRGPARTPTPTTATPGGASSSPSPVRPPGSVGQGTGGDTAAVAAGTNGKKTPPPHPIESEPHHRRFLARSLGRCDAELAALNKLHKTLRVLKKKIIEEHGEDALLDLGEGIIRLASPGTPHYEGGGDLLRSAVVRADGGSGPEAEVPLPESALASMYRDFLIRMRLRRRLLNRLARRLNRVSRSMDGEDPAPPPAPKYGDMRFSVDERKETALKREKDRSREAKLRLEARRAEERMREIAAEMSMRDDDNDNVPSDADEGKDDGPDNTTAEIDFTVDTLKKEPLEVPSSSSVDPANDELETAAALVASKEQKASDEKRYQSDLALVAEFDVGYDRIYRESGEGVGGGGSDGVRPSSSGSTSRPSTSGSGVSSSSSLEFAYVLAEEARKAECDPDNEEEPDYVAIKYGAGVGAAHRTMSAREKESEWDRWQADILGRVPDQPTFKELGMDQRAFHLEERRKRAIEEKKKREEVEQKIIEEAKERMPKSVVPLPYGGKELRRPLQGGKELRQSLEESKSEEDDDDDSDDDEEESGDSDSDGGGSEADVEQGGVLMDSQDELQDETASANDKTVEESKFEENTNNGKGGGDTQAEAEDMDITMEEDKSSDGDSDSDEEDESDDENKEEECDEEEEGTKIVEDDRAHLNKIGEDMEVETPEETVKVKVEVEDNPKEVIIEKKEMEMAKKTSVSCPPKRRKLLSLHAVPSFHDQDLRRIRLIHSDLVSSHVAEHARKRVADATSEYNKLYRLSTELNDRKVQVHNDLTKLLLRHRMEAGKRKNDHPLQVAIARSIWTRSKQKWEAGRDTRRAAARASGADTPGAVVGRSLGSIVDRVMVRNAARATMKGSPQTWAAAFDTARSGDRVRSEVGRVLGLMVDAVVGRCEAPGRWVDDRSLNSNALPKEFKKFVPPPLSTDRDPIINTTTGETMSQYHERLESNMRREMTRIQARLGTNEEERKRAWRKLLKVKQEFEPAVAVGSGGNYRRRAAAAAVAAAGHVHIPAPPLRGTPGGPLRYAPQPLPDFVPPPQNLAAATAVAAPAPNSAVTNPRTPRPGQQRSESKYSAERIRARKYSDGSVMPVTMPKKDKNGLYMRPAGRRRKGMNWDAIRGVWIPSDNPDSTWGE